MTCSGYEQPVAVVCGVGSHGWLRVAASVYEMAVSVYEMAVSGDQEQVRAYPVSGRGLRAWRVMKARWQCTCVATARRAS